MPTSKRWYIEATGHTNEVISAELPSENAHKGVLCQDGMERDFWECDYRFVSKLLKNETTGRLDFKVFYREGTYGPVKLWPFLKKRRMTLSKAMKKGIVKKGGGSAQTGVV